MRNRAGVSSDNSAGRMVAMYGSIISMPQTTLQTCVASPRKRWRDRRRTDRMKGRKFITDGAMFWRIALSGLAAVVVVMMTPPADAQSRKPTAQEIAAIRDCVTKNKDDVDAGEQQCLLQQSADPCVCSPSPPR